LEKRIVITGLGTLNAIANNVADFAVALQAGACGIKKLELFDTTEFRSQMGGQINDVGQEQFPSDGGRIFHGQSAGRQLHHPNHGFRSGLLSKWPQGIRPYQDGGHQQSQPHRRLR